MNRTFMSCARFANIGEPFKPVFCGRIDGTEIRDVEALEKVLFEIAAAIARFAERLKNLGGAIGRQLSKRRTTGDLQGSSLLVRGDAARGR
ncbi:MAG: hypothetical protein ACRERU_11860 [Methylococcales bacterium]